jgi:hypothetical protein
MHASVNSVRGGANGHPHLIVVGDPVLSLFGIEVFCG